MGKFLCESCNSECTVIVCDQCHAKVLRGLLGDSTWLSIRGNSSGDLPGETLADSIRRELHTLEKR